MRPQLQFADISIAFKITNKLLLQPDTAPIFTSLVEHVIFLLKNDMKNCRTFLKCWLFKQSERTLYSLYTHYYSISVICQQEYTRVVVAKIFVFRNFESSPDSLSDFSCLFTNTQEMLNRTFFRKNGLNFFLFLQGGPGLMYA